MSWSPEWAYSRCAGISLTLISLVELGVVLSGLYFFSTGGASFGDVLKEESQEFNDSFQTLKVKQHSYSFKSWVKWDATAHYWQRRKEVFVYLGLLSIAGLMLYLSPSCGALGAFFTGTGARLSTSKPADNMYSVNSDRSLFKCVNKT